MSTIPDKYIYSDLLVADTTQILKADQQNAYSHTIIYIFSVYYFLLSVFYFILFPKEVKTRWKCSV